ncbi:hypothetical protein AB5I41_09700 [Sphingomonas sp. MMS24-JH45]
MTDAGETRCSSVARGRRDQSRRAQGDGWDLEAAWRGRSNFIGEQLGLRDVDGSGIRAGWN